MPFLSLATAVAAAAKSAVKLALAPFIKEATEAAIDTATDTVRSGLGEKMPAEGWAKIVVGAIDSIKNQVAEENGFRYVGGKLNFALAEGDPDKVIISFQLYFIDSMGKWQKTAAESDMPANKFTDESLNEMREGKTISFDVR